MAITTLINSGLGDGRALAMGPGDVDHGWQAILRLAQPVKQWQDVIAAKIDQLGMFCLRQSPAVVAGDCGFCSWRR